MVFFMGASPFQTKPPAGPRILEPFCTLPTGKSRGGMPAKCLRARRFVPRSRRPLQEMLRFADVLGEGHMKTRLVGSCALILLSLAPPAVRADGPDPRENNFRFFVDGTQIDGVVGYQIAFTQNPASTDGQRRLNVLYAPDQRRLVITVTQKGLNRLQDWLNSATDTGTPISKTVQVQAMDNQSNTLARWELTSVKPSTFS